MNMHRVLLTVASLVPCCGLHAQDLELVDQGVADVGPLNVSLRYMQADLRVPTGFDQVFRLVDHSRMGVERNLYVRRNGGIAAVFPQSAYIATPEGVFPEIPAGTIFHIGGVEGPIETPDSGYPSPVSLERRASPGAPHRSASSIVQPGTETPVSQTDQDDLRRREAARIFERSMFHEVHRQRRVAELMQRAAAAASSDSSD